MNFPQTGAWEKITAEEKKKRAAQRVCLLQCAGLPNPDPRRPHALLLKRGVPEEEKRCRK